MSASTANTRRNNSLHAVRFHRGTFAPPRLQWLLSPVWSLAGTTYGRHAEAGASTPW
ncbi:MAG TPA: hypothetical protein VGK20_11575 [Candidatus Binatia bacterium]